MRFLLRNLLFLILLFFSAAVARAAEPNPQPNISEHAASENSEKIDYLLSEEEPYTPRDTDYAIEIGSMAEHRSLYWLGANMGQHIGRCILTSSQTCQQFLDGIIGVGGRDAETYGLFLGSLRWQFVNFPRSWSPLIRIFAGSMRAHRSEDETWRFAAGVGVGAITFLHDKVDLRSEIRVGYTERPFSQVMLAIHFKADRLVIYFAEKLGELGIATVKGVKDQFTPSEKQPEEKPTSGKD